MISENTSNLEPYSIMNVVRSRDKETSYIGARDKFWHTDKDGVRWLIKLPRKNTGEHWSEKAAHEIAKALGIDSAQIEFARVGKVMGTASKNFILDPNLNHLLGNEFLWGHITGYDRFKKSKQTMHSIGNIISVLKKFSIEHGFLQYLLLDTLIGNTDRHHQNWGVFVGKEGTFLTPTYDHASSMGRELRDERRKLILNKISISTYVKNCRCPIYMHHNDKHEGKPFELLRKACDELNVDLSTGVINKEKLENLQNIEIYNIFDKMPQGMMSRLAKRFAIEYISYNIKRVLNIEYDC